MHRFFAALISAVPAILLSQMASAADMPVKARPKVVAPAPVYSWTGCYVGVNAGGHWGSVNDPAVITNNTWFTGGGGTDLASAAAAFPNTLNPSGFAGGGQFGCNWQMSNFVIGAEGDITGLTGSASRNTSFLVAGGGNNFVTDSAKDEWMSTVRARAGWAFDRVLVYATGGVAFAHWSFNHAYSNTFDPGFATNVTTSTTRTGWTVGGGLEYALTNNWTVRGEYLYADFGTFNNYLTHFSPTFGGTGFTVLHPEKLRENIARAGLNYKF